MGAHFKSWALVVLIFGIIEGAIYLARTPDPLDSTNFLQLGFGNGAVQRHFIFEKMKAFADSKPTIVQVGDSSGFYGIEPAVVMQHLPNGAEYINLSCCANAGFNGYYNILDFMARRNSSIRYMVLHITPYTMPRPELWERDGANLWGGAGLEVFGDAVKEEFLSWKRFFHVPSLSLRREVTDAVFYLTPLRGSVTEGIAGAAGRGHPLHSPPYLEFMRDFRNNRGWMPESDIRGGVYASECDVPTPKRYGTTYIEHIFEKYAELAAEHHSKLVIVFQPVACVFGTGKGSAAAREAIERFKAKHPEVEVPFPFIETWPVEMFSVPAHVVREHTDLIGNRLGLAMKQIMAKDERSSVVKTLGYSTPRHAGTEEVRSR
jgi:hypothetical protein